MKKWTLLFVLAISFQLSAQVVPDSLLDLTLFQKRTYVNKDEKMLPFRILYPENYDKKKKYPLVLFLHGAGERGDDNESQLTHGARLFLRDENRKKFPAIVVFPQCPAESFWSTVSVDRSKMPVGLVFNNNNPPNVPLSSSFELVKKLILEEGADASRIYIAGLSMGGMGTFEAVYLYPNMFAAAMPICGGGDAANYDSRVLKTPFWIFHGASDPVVDVKNSREMVDKLKKLKADIKYTEYQGVQHNSWDNAFAEPDFLSWMFSHQRR